MSEKKKQVFSRQYADSEVVMDLPDEYMKSRKLIRRGEKQIELPRTEWYT